MLREFAGPASAWLLAVAAIAGPVAGSSAAPQLPAALKPNVVMIMADDLDMDVFDSALEGGYLPNIQREFVEKSTRFVESFVALPLCCPSRTTYLTGQYPHNHGILADSGQHGGFQQFDRDGSTLATWLHAAGYRTGLVGKYLNGYGFSPKDDHGTYTPPAWDTWDAVHSVHQYDYDMSMNGTVFHYGNAEVEYQTDVLAGLALDFLRHARSAQPFFLTLTPTAPHYEDADGEGGHTIRPPRRYLDTPPLKRLPVENRPSFNEAEMSDKPQWMRTLPLVDVVDQRTGYNSRIAAMRAVDDMVGTVVATLSSTGELANTLLIFTSDNGFQYGTHRLINKTTMYEESIRVPLYIRAPGQTQARTAAAWAMNIDWAPTIVDYAGADPDIPMDGRSLRPWVTAGSASGRHTLLVEHPPSNPNMASRPAYAMIRTRDPALTGDANRVTVLVYAETYSPANELTDREYYDLSKDPYQISSQAGSSDPGIKARMRALAARLAELETCVGEQCRSLQE